MPARATSHADHGVVGRAFSTANVDNLSGARTTSRPGATKIELPWQIPSCTNAWICVWPAHVVRRTAYLAEDLSATFLALKR